MSETSTEDEKGLYVLEKTTTVDGKRYDVGLLWERTELFSPNHYSTEESQMRSLDYKLEKTLETEKLYQDSITVDVEKGFVRS